MASYLEDNSFAPVTAVLDSGGNQIFETVGILQVSASSNTAYPQHTLENGVTISDHSIRLQDQVALRCILDPDDYVEVYRRIKRAFRQNAAFIIQTKVETYTNMYMQSLPHEEGAKNTVSLIMEFLEQRFQSPNVGTLPLSSVANPADSDSRNSGNKQAQSATDQQSQTVLDSMLGGLL
jgi:hypothetical protein